MTETTSIKRVPADLEWTAADGAHERIPIGKIIRDQSAEIDRLRNGLNNIATTEALRTVDEIKAYARTVATTTR